MTVGHRAAVCLLVLACLTTASSAQSPAQAPATPYDKAAAAFNTGKYDDISGILGGDSSQRAIALRGRALIARGKYAEAEKLLAPAAQAQPTDDAALELGILQLKLGRRADGKATLETILRSGAETTARDLLRLGLAARALGMFQDANGFLRDAAAKDPENPEINTAWGELFLEKYNLADAKKSFEAALADNEDYVPAELGLAKTIAEENPPDANKLALHIVDEVNPSYVPAHLFIAEMLLDDRHRDEAKKSIAEALKVNPNELEALALDASIDALEGRTAEFEQKAQAILKVNPGYGDAYRIAGDQMSRNYRFDEAVELTKKALTIEPDSVKASADLGLQLLRTGDEAGARVALERAFKADPYDVVTYNLLQMLDSVDKFVTIRDGDIVMRLHPEEEAVMREFAMPLAKEALAWLSKQYEFTPQGPILIEMFPKHDDFAVRTLGLPGMIGALGACFGKVVTLDSPRARPPGQFTWAGTLWHELTHVITLQMSNNRIPRWLSEGMSQFEEHRRNPVWGREMEMQYAQALELGRTLPIKDINNGFSDPRMISLSYYQASLIVDHIIKTYGEPKLRELLRAYGRGLEGDAAMKASIGVDIDGLQKSFDGYIATMFAPIRAALQTPNILPMATMTDLKALATANPGSFRMQMRLAMALEEDGDHVGAIAALERADKLMPQATGDANANKTIAKIAIETGQDARAVQALEALLKVDYADIEAARSALKLIDQKKEPARTLALYEIVAELDPFDSAAQRYVGHAALERKDTTRAIAAFRAALAAKPPDLAGAHIDLAEAYFAAGQTAEAKQQALAGLEIAPSFERAQDLLLKIVGS